MTFQKLVLTFGALLSVQAWSKPCYSPEALSDIFERAEIANKNGRHPAVVLDLDDTVFDTRARTYAIWKDFMKISGNAGKYPHVQTAFDGLKGNSGKLQFMMADTLEKLDSVNLSKDSKESKEFNSEFFQFWNARFFHDTGPNNEKFPYIANDKPNPYSAEFVNQLVKHGIKVIYLTGRPAKDMQAGTEASLRKITFPLAIDQKRHSC